MIHNQTTEDRVGLNLPGKWFQRDPVTGNFVSAEPPQQFTHQQVMGFIEKQVEAATRIAKLEEALREAINDVEAGDLEGPLCCSGHECGCYGSTKGEWLIYNLRTLLQQDQPS